MHLEGLGGMRLLCMGLGNKKALYPWSLSLCSALHCSPTWFVHICKYDEYNMLFITFIEYQEEP